jgi:hypothetical protein
LNSANIKVYSPVLICTLNRYEHFRRCIESLKRCNGSNKTDLYIAFDYPLKNTHWDGYHKIKIYIDEIAGFKSVTVIERTKNYGSRNNYFRAEDIVFEKYDRFIYSEDDNEFSPNFLEYVNKGLEIFYTDPNIYAVCGYNFPIDMPTNYRSNYYINSIFAGWGFGHWRHKRWEQPKSISEIYDYYKDPLELLKSERNGHYLLPHLLNMNRSGQLYGDTLINLYLLRDRKYCIFPYISKVKNHGHDGSGENSGIDLSKLYTNQIIDTDSTFVFKTEDPKIYEPSLIQYEIANYFRRSLLKRIYTYFMFLLLIVRRKLD